MNQHDLSKQIELHNVNNENGWGVEIIYIRRSTDKKYYPKAMPQDVDFEGKKDNYGSRDALESRMVFMSVELDFLPSKGDSIKHDNRSWYVDKFDGSNGIYDIFATSGTTHIGGRGRQ